MSELRQEEGWQLEESSAVYSLGDFVLEEGYTLRDCKLAYATFGELNEA
jgi:homoserine acetyltransferase